MTTSPGTSDRRTGTEASHVFFSAAKGTDAGAYVRLCATARRHSPIARTGIAVHSCVMYRRESAPVRNPKVPSPFNRRRLTVATLGISDAAIARAYANPASVRESTLLRLQKAAEELGT